MATAVATTVVRLVAMPVAVDVTTDCMPPISWVMRDWISPLRVRVKKPTDWRCKWEKTSVRRLCITRWPTLVAIQVCRTPNRAVTAATASMPAVSKASSGSCCWGRAVSMTARSRNGEAMAAAEEATMMAVTKASCLR